MCVAVCCSVLQCIAVCCSAFQCDAVWCGVLQCVAVCCIAAACCSAAVFNHVMLSGAVCCSLLCVLQWVCRLLQRVAVRCSTLLQCVAMCCNVLQRVAVRCSVLHTWLRGSISIHNICTIHNVMYIYVRAYTYTHESQWCNLVVHIHYTSIYSKYIQHMLQMHNQLPIHIPSTHTWYWGTVVCCSVIHYVCISSICEKGMHSTRERCILGLHIY